MPASRPPAPTFGRGTYASNHSMVCFDPPTSAIDPIQAGKQASGADVWAIDPFQAGKQASGADVWAGHLRVKP